MFKNKSEWNTNTTIYSTHSLTPIWPVALKSIATNSPLGRRSYFTVSNDIYEALCRKKNQTEKSHYSHFIMQECSLRSRFRRLETDDIAANILCGDARSADATNKNARIALVDNIKRFRTVLRSILHRSFQRRMHELVHCVWRMCSIGTYTIQERNKTQPVSLLPDKITQ